ncbi:HAD family phosphatase [Alteromonas alba]|uniref:HAD family phosphatase n=1 Tax=Alteromonas alba TaxID=2079529 RepID=A0A2S9VBT9_9ALTE|nr:HAD family phosphatase [Alteromonas alba]MCP4866816.1 HAD family phosphatase [Alteromonas sp.]PRO73912.1 HAD family phosphatase [Alteromonas alba]
MANPGAALQAILFDHDGTLINSEAVHFKLWQQTLAPYDVELTDAYYNETMAGVPTSQNGVDVVRDFKLSAEPAALADTKTRLTEEHLQKAPFPLMPGALETMTLCHELGLRIAIVTGGSKYSVQRTLECYGFADWVECVVAVEDVEHSKPAPDCYLMALEHMGLTAEQAMAVEDTEHGLAAAVAAGLQCVAIPTEQSMGHDFSAAAAVYQSLSAWTNEQFS